ncbi:asparagine synthetase B [Chryseolinea sp. H1M3-3]|uniref:asparagine synthetase B n=1 Tax=Chryseolinea sp. H1M3-3 TaxID=3034144 RepID=UPI0023EAD45E|nr:asparagine synthetase B [Chryseolinea sp. H1M3-3]
MKKFRASLLAVFLLASVQACIANAILIPMDEAQKNHLKSYGLAFDALQRGGYLDWLLNYRGGSFLFPYEQYIHSECVVRGISFEVLSSAAVNAILTEIESPAVNMNVVRLEKSPRIAVYSPKGEFLKDETDAVITVLDYAEIPYTIIYDEEVVGEQLVKYDWLHLHHEDFTGQAGRHLRPESQLEADLQKITASKLGYANVTAMKLDVAKKIKGFCAGGGYLFAMCSGAETFDIALAADGVDISETMYDGDEVDPDAQSKLDFSKTLAFENFTMEPGYSRRFSDINTGWGDYWQRSNDFFSLFQFSAKWDIIPSLLTQNHEHAIREFIGQTTAFSKYVVKPAVLVLAENRRLNNVRYIYGELGRGHWTFYSGHDPEGTPGRWREPTDLNQHPNSPGYRLILNNVLFPSAKKKKQKT